jgi:hypothetical protein
MTAGARAAGATVAAVLGSAAATAVRAALTDAAGVLPRLSPGGVRARLETALPQWQAQLGSTPVDLPALRTLLTGLSREVTRRRPDAALVRAMQRRTTDLLESDLTGPPA